MVGSRRRSGWARLAPVALVLAPAALAACGSSSTGKAAGSSSSAGNTADSSGSVQASAGYPASSISLIAPVSAGSNGDLIARQVAKDLHVGASVSVVDRPGGAGISGVTQVVQSSSDGATLGLVPNGALLLQPQMKQLPYGAPATYTAIAQVTEEFDALLVSSSSKWQTVGQFISYAKAHPGRLRVEVAPVGSVPNIDVRLLEQLAGVKFTLVPGVASAGAVTDLLGGHVDAVVGTINSAQCTSRPTRWRRWPSWPPAGSAPTRPYRRSRSPATTWRYRSGTS